jgi:hypothetical protein
MSTVPEDWLNPAPPQLLEASDRFVTGDGADAGLSVAEFWTWAFSDLRSNATRGVLAEFIVGTALGATTTRREDWDNYDLLTPDGVRVEVKASAYLQAWPQRALFDIRFSGLMAQSWDKNTNSYDGVSAVRADVFVFCVHTCREHETYNTLDLGQWEFYVVSGEDVRAAGVKSVGLARVRTWAEPVGFDDLRNAVQKVAA